MAVQRQGDPADLSGGIPQTRLAYHSRCVSPQQTVHSCFFFHHLPASRSLLTSTSSLLLIHRRLSITCFTSSTVFKLPQWRSLACGRACSGKQPIRSHRYGP